MASSTTSSTSSSSCAPAAPARARAHAPPQAGSPAPDRCYIFNGDYVDRGAWGVETLSLVLAWKLALPASVVVLRGNHESRFCCSSYGFFRELAAKYGSSACALQKPLLRLFSSLPLGCRVGAAFVCHGGLFRKSARAARGGCRAADAAAEDGSLPLSALGSLEELRCASRGSADPDGQGERRLASDVLWSDPGRDPGLRENALRGIGLVFGPDATQAFLRANGLRLVIRSHEGPDAREKRADMGSMGDGWSVDHEGAEGRLATLFSAPDYPMFYAPGAARARNRAAVALLSQPSFCQPQLLRFEAAPRPDSGCAYYELDAPGSDEEGGAPRAAEAAGAGAKRVAEGEPVEDSAPADAEPPATQSPSRGAAAEADTPATCAVSLPAS